MYHSNILLANHKMMKRKISLLIIGCVITVVALTCIQGYFICNTYKLEAKEANTAITKQFLEMETTGKLDSVNNVWMKKTKQFISLYTQKKVTKEDYKKLIKKASDSLTGIIANHISKKGIFKEYEVSYANYIVSVMLIKENRKVGDTLFKGKQILFGNNTENIPETQVSQSKWTSNTFANISEEMCTTGDECLYFEVVTERYYSIENWERQVFIKMAGLLGFSLLLLAFVVLLFYWSIKNLITQKKINDIKSDFINNITHEFQTPLAALDIAVTTLKKKEQKLTPEQFNNALSIIERQNVRMQKLFNEVAKASLATDSIDTSNTKEITSADIHEIINDFKLSHPGVEILFNENNGVTFYMDRFHLDTILINLLDNAEKYGAGVITLKLEKSAKGITLAIQDNGIGIAKKEQLAIFDKFYRVQKGDIHTTKGLGLGLFYVNRIIEAYMGTITVSSEEGKGATFIISIP